MNTTRLLNSDESVYTHACPRRGSIPEPMRQDRNHHALMTMPTAVGLIQNNNETMTLKLCYSNMYMQIIIVLCQELLLAMLLKYGFVTIRSIMTGRIVFSGRKFYTM
jgi:hypothetical protein